MDVKYICMSDILFACMLGGSKCYVIRLIKVNEMNSQFENAFVELLTHEMKL